MVVRNEVNDSEFDHLVSSNPFLNPEPAHEEGKKYKVRRKKPLLTQKQKETRLKFAKAEKKKGFKVHKHCVFYDDHYFKVWWPQGWLEEQKLRVSASQQIVPTSTSPFGEWLNKRFGVVRPSLLTKFGK